MPYRSKVFIDTGAFIALHSRDDRYHQDSMRIYQKLVSENAALVTTNHVVAETANWLLRERAAGHERALRFRAFLEGLFTPVSPDSLPAHLPSAAGALLIYPSYSTEQTAWDILTRYDTAGFSFTDCVSFAVMQAMSISHAFAFDTHFDVVGFERL